MSAQIGKSVGRVDAYEKVTGKASFASDYLSRADKMPQMRLLTSPHAHAKIVSLDIGRARAVPGVLKIITGGEPDVAWESFPRAARIAREATGWAGQVVAMVLAETEEAAQAAVSAIKVEYEICPHVLNIAETMQPGAGDQPRVGQWKHGMDDMAAAFKGCDVVVERTYSAAKKAPSPMETAVCVCEHSPDGTLTLTSNGAGAHGIKQTLCRALGLPQSGVRVRTPYTGGARTQPAIESLVALMASRAGRSVACRFSRKQMFTTAPGSRACNWTLKLGAKKDGTIIAGKFSLAEDAGAGVGAADFDGRLAVLGATPVYRIPNCAVDAFAVATNTAPATGDCATAAFGIECALNELAAALELSPVEIRLKNMRERGEADILGQPACSTRLAKCLQSVADALEIAEEPEQDLGVWKRGRGVAVGALPSPSHGRAEARVWYNCDGTIELFTSPGEAGAGITTMLAQICADELGAQVESVKVICGDTATAPYAAGTDIYTIGNAVVLACGELKAKLREEVAREHGVHPTTVEIKGTSAVLGGVPQGTVPILPLFKDASPPGQGVWGLKIGTPVEGVGAFCPAPQAVSVYEHSAVAVEVIVNEETGRVQVVRVAASVDSGNTLNPELARGQIIGGVHAAIGHALGEEMLLGVKGQITNPGLAEYRLPNILDMPRREHVHALTAPDPLSGAPHGVKGMGESSGVAVAPAIAEAVYRAVGVRMDSYPMTAQRVLAAIKARKAKEAKR